MKRLILLSTSILLIGIACKAKKVVASSGNTTEAQLTAVKARFPDVTKEELEKGHSVYTGACTRCHGTKDVTAYTEPRLLEIVEDMSKKAKITNEEKQALIRFAVGVRATSK
jgi:hypothetical protein